MSRTTNKTSFIKQRVWVVGVTLNDGQMFFADFDAPESEIQDRGLRTFPSRKDARECAVFVREDAFKCGIRSATPMKAVLVVEEEFVALESLARASAANQKDCRYWRNKAYRLTAEVGRGS